MVAGMHSCAVIRLRAMRRMRCDGVVLSVIIILVKEFTHGRLERVKVTAMMIWSMVKQWPQVLECY